MASPRRFAAGSREALGIGFGSLYPALKRLELKGWIASRWETSDRNRRAKHYRLTPSPGPAAGSIAALRAPSLYGLVFLRVSAWRR